MRPTGRLHLGNLHGALDNWIQLQTQYDCFFFVADWHALTTDYASPGQIRQNTWDMVLDWLSAGLDPNLATLFIQSDIKEHAELYLLLGMITPLPWLERNPTYKEQQQQLDQKDLATYGFLGYPVLQAADIIIYRAHGVPVGKDQLPHVELTREIARRFNFMYQCEVFPIPDALLTEVPVLPGLDGRKMSKSYGNTIPIFADDKTLRKQVMRIVTDSRAPEEPKNPDGDNLFQIFRLFATPERTEEVRHHYLAGGLGYGTLKQELYETIRAYFADARQQFNDYMQDITVLDRILAQGAVKARDIAIPVLKRMRKAVGIDR